MSLGEMKGDLLAAAKSASQVGFRAVNWAFTSWMEPWRIVRGPLGWISTDQGISMVV